MRHLLALTILMATTLLALGGCADAKGDSCENDKQCGGGLICAALAACTGESCEGVCAKQCMSDDDCNKNENCVDDAANARMWCRPDGI